jgi:hypothetical protein
MGILGYLQKIFGKKAQSEALAIAATKDEALQQRSEAPQALQSAAIIEEKPPSSIELQKDSLQLGLAAGYTGRSLREIESSLTRIESQVVTKDWFSSQFGDHVAELIDLFKKHEENEQKRFEAIQSVLNSLYQTAEKAPEPVKAELFQEIKAIERQLPLTPKMKELLQVVKESREISYDELHNRLGISISALRGLLTNMAKRTDQIERFEKDNKGWAKYTGN